MKKALAIIILNWNGADDTIECLSTIDNYSLYDVYVVNNGSSKVDAMKLIGEINRKNNSQIVDDIASADIDNKNITLYLINLNENMGFARGNNYVANAIKGYYSYLLLLNNDTFVPEGTIEHMLKTAYKKRTVALTCDIRNYYDKSKLWNAGGKFTIYGDRKYYSQKRIDRLIKKRIEYIDAEFITGCALMVDSAFVMQYGLFTDLFFHGEEDFNLCIRLKNMGKKVGVDLAVTLYHKVGQTIGRATATRNEYNKMLLHVVNRIVDYKTLYGYNKWKVWRILYLFLVFIKRLISGMKISDSYRLIKYSFLISSKYDNVKKNVFDKIMHNDWSNDV